jgi:hypothetical protein
MRFIAHLPQYIFAFNSSEFTAGNGMHFVCHNPSAWRDKLSAMQKSFLHAPALNRPTKQCLEDRPINGGLSRGNDFETLRRDKAAIERTGIPKRPRWSKIV